MKVNLLKSVVIENRRRSGVMLVASLFVISLALMSGVAQLKNSKRVTALQVGQAAEGARVTIVSDSALNDYEAFRRGDRFYVKIPAADFAAGQPNFHGDGFEDIQVQKVGDSVVVSFKLEPGASARVDQRSNRLDVIFSSPNRSARNINPANRRTAEAANVIPVNAAQTLPPRNDAGPAPPSSPSISRERVVSETSSDGQGAQSSTMYDNPRAGSNKKAQPSTNAKGSASPKPGSSATVPASTPSIYPELSTATPISVSATPGTNSAGSAASAGWKARSKVALRWVAANRVATLVAAVLLLGVLVFFGSDLYRRRNYLAKTKRAKSPRVQPKYSPDELNEKVAAGSVSSSESASSEIARAYESSFSRIDSTSLAAPLFAANDARRSAVSEKTSGPRIVPEQAVSESVAIAAPASRPWVPTKPSVAPSTAGQFEAISEDQEREVFEL